jgi:cytoskeleton protein RodZ
MNDSIESPGPRLRRERERQNLSMQKAADAMRLDAWAVEALENDDYERVGPPVYAKGHLKKYALVLGLPAAELIYAYESFNSGAAATAKSSAAAAAPAAPMVRPQGPSTERQRPGIGRGIGQLPWRQAGAIALLAVVLGVLLWKPWRHHPAVAPGAVVSAPRANEPPAAAAAAPPAAATVRSDGSSAEPTGTAGTAAMAAAQSADATPIAGAGEAGSGHARLRMRFSADSWVEVRDAAGKRVFSGQGRANSVKNISGEAPLRVYLGFASGVQLEINERAVAIGPPFVDGDVARFQAGADGILRTYSGNTRPRG